MPSSAGQTSALRSEEHTSELQSHDNLVCRLLLETKKPQFSSAGFSASGGGGGGRGSHAVWGRCVFVRWVVGWRRRSRRRQSLFFFFFNIRAPPKLSPLPPPGALQI